MQVEVKQYRSVGCMGSSNFKAKLYLKLFWLYGPFNRKALAFEKKFIQYFSLKFAPQK
jgi:hypothetical protein